MSSTSPERSRSLPEAASIEEPVYTKLVIDHYRRPRNRGRLASADAAAEARSPICGDELRVTLALAAGRVTDVRFDGDGCALSQALASLASERYPGMSVEQILALDETFTVGLLGSEVSRHRRGCAMLHLVTVQRALGAGGAM
ncbi:MAG: iron-sulfur cluster assembly scaffold protein [Conexibacter sp.]